MGCIASKVPVEEVSEGSLNFFSEESIQQPPPAFVEESHVESIDTRRSLGTFQRTSSSDAGYYLNNQRYIQAKLKVDAWFARVEEAVEDKCTQKVPNNDITLESS